MIGGGRLEVLDPAECLRLLRTRAVGRLAVNRRGFGPLVVPVVYVVDDTGAIVFRTGVGTKLARITGGAVSFQVDDVDEATRTGWSVLVEGLAHEIDADDEPARSVHSSLPDLPLAVRVVPNAVSGRRITAPRNEGGAAPGGGP